MKCDFSELENSPAFLYGESIFTTCRVENAEIMYWSEHLARLIQSAANYYMVNIVHCEDWLKSKVLESIANIDLSVNGRLRIMVSANPRESLLGDFNMAELNTAGLNIYSQFKAIDFSLIKPVRLMAFKRMQDENLDSFKIGSYGQSFYLKRLAISKGFEDILFVDNENIYEASSSNIFFKKGDTFITPKSGIYKGLIREKRIGKESQNIEVRDVLISELAGFDSCFLTNSINLQQDVVGISIDGDIYNF